MKTPRPRTTKPKDTTPDARIPATPARTRKASARSVATRPRAAATTEDVARRAYEIFLARQDAEGSPLDDWLRAERELGALKA